MPPTVNDSELGIVLRREPVVEVVCRPCPMLEDGGRDLVTGLEAEVI